MASEATHSAHYIGKVLPGGHLEIPKAIIEKMDLKHGDEVAVAIQKIGSTERQASVPEQAHVLIEELIGTPKNLKEAVEALAVLATQMMSQKKQRRLSHLLWKNQDGIITTKEEKELDALVTEGQEATIRKAKAILALKHLGIDIVSDLEKSLKGKLH